MDEITNYNAAPVLGAMPMDGATTAPEERNRQLANAQFIRPVDAEQCRKWNVVLAKYKSAKHKSDQRFVAAEEWWRLRNEFQEDEVSDAGDQDLGFRAKSAWMFNTIASKHADYLEAYPEPNVLARAEDDKGTAYMLSRILPVVLKTNKFKTTYSLNGWQKMKTGTGIYKVIWDKTKLHGMGDVSIVRRSLLNVFWEPGISDIQQSKYFFDVEMIDKDELMYEYPELQDKELSSAVVPEHVKGEDTWDYADKVAVVEVYYKRRGKLHYAKYVGETVLYATENDNEIIGTDRHPMTGMIQGVHTKAADGLYDHGMYPFVFDTLFPVEGSPAGFGYVDICANAMTRIDKSIQALLENTEAGATPRWFIRSDGNINEQEFLNLKKKFVHVPGGLDDQNIRLIDVPPLNGNHISVLNSFISELRETSGNTEAGNGIRQSGVTAASAYALMQEASGKLSRDSTDTTYTAFEQICMMVQALMTQFYETERQFRIVGAMGADTYVNFSNEGMVPQWQGMVEGVDMGYRVPEFDIEIVPEKQTNYTKLSQNEMAMELYGKGFFNPELADQALITLDMMDFNGKDEIIQKVSMNGTMLQELRRWQQLALQLAARYEPGMVQGLSGAVTGVGAEPTLSTEGQQAGLGFGEGPTDEPTIVKNARQRARESTQPGGSAV